MQKFQLKILALTVAILINNFSLSMRHRFNANEQNDQEAIILIDQTFDSLPPEIVNKIFEILVLDFTKNCKISRDFYQANQNLIELQFVQQKWLEVMQSLLYNLVVKLSKQKNIALNKFSLAKIFLTKNKLQEFYNQYLTENHEQLGLKLIGNCDINQIKKLIKSGAFIDMQNASGLTAIENAIYRHFDEGNPRINLETSRQIIELLISTGAEFSKPLVKFFNNKVFDVDNPCESLKNINQILDNRSFHQIMLTVPYDKQAAVFTISMLLFSHLFTLFWCFKFNAPHFTGFEANALILVAIATALVLETKRLAYTGKSMFYAGKITKAELKQCKMNCSQYVFLTICASYFFLRWQLCFADLSMFDI